MKKIKIVILAVAVILTAGCVATAIAYPFFGRTSPPDTGNNDSEQFTGPGTDPSTIPDTDPGENFNPDPNPEPLPDPNSIPRPEFVRGLYMTGNVVGWAPEKREKIFGLIRDTGLNSLVINVKNDIGQVTYKKSQVQLALEAGANTNLITSKESLFEALREAQIYPIARIVVAKDQYLCSIRPKWFLQHKDGGVWKDKHDNAWADLRNTDYWDYLIAIAIEASEMGFREIQFDYVRWPNSGDGLVKDLADDVPDYNLSLEGPYTRTEVIKSFLTYAQKKLAPYDVEISADIFGIMGTAKHEETVGQQLELLLCSGVDIICPMMYPGHYAKNTYGQPLPNRVPYEVIRQSTKDYTKRMKEENSNVELRPWLQDFTDARDNSFHYGTEQIHDQIQALEELGIKEYLFWNADNIYTDEAYRSWDWNK